MGGRDREAASLVRRAKSELRAGNRREALSLLQKALAIDPESNAVTEAILQIERESSSKRATEKSAGATKRPSASDGGGAKKRRSSSSPAKKSRTGSGKKAKRKTARKKPKAPPKSPGNTPEDRGGGEPSKETAGPASRPRRRSRRLRAVPDALEEDNPAAKKMPDETLEEEPSETSPPTEREGSMASSDQLQTLLDTTEDAMRAGDDSRAVDALKRARSMAPEDSRVLELTERYKASRKARKAIALAKKALEGGSRRKATAYARKAFELDSQAPGIEELLANIEKGSSKAATAQKDRERPASPSASSGQAESYVQKIREKIQISSFPEAAKLTEEALGRFPKNELLQTFGEKFKKMGLMG